MKRIPDLDDLRCTEGGGLHRQRIGYAYCVNCGAMIIANGLFIRAALLDRAKRDPGK